MYLVHRLSGGHGGREAPKRTPPRVRGPVENLAFKDAIAALTTRLLHALYHIAVILGTF